MVLVNCLACLSRVDAVGKTKHLVPTAIVVVNMGEGLGC